MHRLALLALLASAMAAPAQAARPVQFAEQAAPGGALVLPLGSAADLQTRGAMLDPATRDSVARALESARFRYRTSDVLTLRGLGPWSQITLIGTGGDPLETVELQDIGGRAAHETAATDGPVTVAGVGDAAAAVQIGIGARLGGYSFDRYRSEDPEAPRRPGQDTPLTILTAGAAAATARWQSEGQALSDAVHFTRDLITEPANVIYPESFVERTREAFRGVGNVRIEALDVTAMERLGMGSILAVGRGSERPPRMLIVEYRGAGSPDAPVVLAGKGITFDSGGISLKPGTGMSAMKGDMAGAAAAVGAVLSLARARAPVHVVAIAALAENMPGGNASRPGDVVRAMNGRTIEIINTDAEGRLVLADAVALAERRFRPAAIVDIATLTGAVTTALGNEYAGLFSRNDGLAGQLLAAGRDTGEELWRLPLHSNYADDMDSDIADIKNSDEGGSPGAGLGAHFIGFFVESTPWAHLDIAGVDMGADQPTVPDGYAGFGVRLLDRFVRNFQPVAAPSSDGN
ncbi:leucyl aminopeptidase [Sphingosinicella sp. LHD-64]|uniref:leucyl aminopeptidase n=1 Tax=Sphingosinicella sp. LHD-64 TaxID=3072139 RepID=UPI00281018A8|nr:leucyl aminopeptidase [Sphingosinicella sp. LHD-64]MDQ8757884.1 leucyl aminopeptidase [Sphingosinicella sp. LHD-64]